MTIPTKREAIVDEIEGVRVADPYRWLEDSQAPDVREWIAHCNEQVDGALKGDAFRRFSDELAKNFKFVQYSNPLPVQGTYFYTERQPDEDQAVLYMKKGLDGAPVKLVDPNGKREGNTITIDYWMPSQSGRYLAYGISEGGDEMATLYVQDTETVQNLSEKIVHCRYSSIRWLPDDSAFFYTRNPRPGTVPKNEEHLHTKVYLHVLGTDPDADALIFGADRPKDDMTNIGISPDGRYVSIFVSRTWTENDVYIYDRESDKVQPLIVGVPSIFSLVFLQDKLLLKTNYKANNHRVLWATYEEMHKPLDAWEEFIPEREFVLESLRVTKSKILAEYLVNACSEVRTFDYEGNATGNIPLPEYSSLAGIASRKEEEEFFYGVESFVFPKMYYRYDPVADAYVAYRKTDNPIRSEGIAHLIEHLIFKGTTKLSECDINMITHKLSGYTNAFTSYDYTGYLFDLPSQQWQPALTIFADCMSNATFKKDFLDSELQAVIQELKMYKDDYVSTLIEKILSAIFPDHPYGYPIIGFKQDLWNVSRETLLNFYQYHYVPNNAMLLGVGDVKPDEFFAQAEKEFSHIEKKEHVAQEFYHSQDLIQQNVTILRDIKQPMFLAAWVINGSKEGKDYIVDLFLYIWDLAKERALIKNLWMIYSLLQS